LKNSRRLSARSALLFSVLSLSMGAVAFACGGVSPDGSGLLDDGDGDGGSGDGSSIHHDSGTTKKDSGGCTGLGCQQVTCGTSTDTTVSGTAYAPNGTTPLYNVIVFVPSSTTKLAPLASGLSCDQCGTVAGDPVTSTTTDANGNFTLHNVPPGTSIPVVFQLGKWRREVWISTVTKCQDNPITDPNQSRLPKNHTEGDIPHIAVTTGTCDSIACVLPKMGIDASEFGVQADYANKRVIMYQGSGPSTATGITAAENLWGNPAEISKYDVSIFSCECDEAPESKAPGDETVVANYLNAGGRTFGTDFMYDWIHKGLEFTGTPPAPISGIMQGFVGGAPSDNDGSYNIDTTFPKGQALGQWLQSVGGSTSPTSIDLTDVWHNFDTVDPTLAQRWVYGDSDKAISFTTPFTSPEANRCGKSYFMDVHVGSSDIVDETFPAGCGTDLSPQEKMMVFFLMDLASCIQDDSQPVNPPR
jgi:hypothetical protein